jgi:hypothetical protein
MEKLEKLKKSLDNKFIPDNMKDKIRAEIKKLESEIKTDETMTATEVKEEVKEIEEKVEKALEVAEKKEEQAEAKAEEKKEKAPRKAREKKVSTSETKTQKVEPKATAKKKSVFSIAKEIRKDGESWEQAKERASKMMKSDTTETKKKVRTETDKLLAMVRRNKEYKKLAGSSNLPKDAQRRALPRGKRVSADGNVYYENRANRVDVGGFKNAYLENGGGIEKYRVFEGIDHYNNKPLYRVEDMSEDGEYVGEWYKTRQEAEDELREMFGNSYDNGGSVDRERFNKFISSQINYIISLKTISQKREPIQNLINNMDDYSGEEIQKRITKDNLKYALQQKTVSKINEVLRISLNALKYADGGTIIGMPETPLARGLDMYYTTLVGETGAMSSGELFAGGGSIENQYEGKTPKQVWEMLNEKQKQHFLLDHFNHFIVEEFKGKNLIDISKLDYNKLPARVRLEFDYHVNKGQYANGGYAEKGVYVETLDEEIDLSEDGRVKAIKTQQGGNKSFGERREMHGASPEALAFAEGGSLGNHGLKQGDQIIKTMSGGVQKVKTKSGDIVYVNLANGYRGDVPQLPFDKGGRIRDRKYLNHSEDYEVRYSKDKPHRRGYGYAEGGVTKNYINRKELNTITIKKGDQKLTYKVSDVYNGAYKLEDGGNLEKMAFYVSKRNIVKVQLKDGKDVKVANGYWIKKGAKPIHTSKYDDGGQLEMEYAGGGSTEVGYFKNEIDNDYISEINKYFNKWNSIKTEKDSENFKKIKPPMFGTYQETDILEQIKHFEKIGIPFYANEVIRNQFKKEVAKIIEKWLNTKSYAGGGKTTFKEKATAIAKNFEGKKVEPKYQKEYGKTYDKAEAKEVGNKIAGSQKAKYDSKMSGGGKTKRGGAMQLAKQIRKDGESWQSALKRANEQMRKK